MFGRKDKSKDDPCGGITWGEIRKITEYFCESRAYWGEWDSEDCVIKDLADRTSGHFSVLQLAMESLKYRIRADSNAWLDDVGNVRRITEKLYGYDRGLTDRLPIIFECLSDRCESPLHEDLLTTVAERYWKEYPGQENEDMKIAREFIADYYEEDKE